MEVQKDFEELLALLNANSVRFLIVGGYAVAFHGAPRYTGDLDILLEISNDNAVRLMRVLCDFGFSELDLSAEDFLRPGKVVQLGVPPVRVDLVTSISGVAWDDAWTGRVAGDYGSVPVHYLGKNQLLTNKRAVRRPKDLMDLEALGES